MMQLAAAAVCSRWPPPTRSKTNQLGPVPRHDDADARPSRRSATRSRWRSASRRSADVEVLMPEFGEALSRYTILNFVPQQRIDDQGKTVLTQRYTLQPYLSGAQFIPPILIEFVDHRPGQKPAPDDFDAYETPHGSDRLRGQVGLAGRRRTRTRSLRWANWTLSRIVPRRLAAVDRAGLGRQRRRRRRRVGLVAAPAATRAAAQRLRGRARTTQQVAVPARGRRTRRRSSRSSSRSRPSCGDTWKIDSTCGHRS